MPDETKPYRDRYGMPMTHGDFRRAHLERAEHRKLSEYDLRDRALSCAGIMEFHGEKRANEDGSTYVDWDGSAIHAYLTCSECGEQWAVDTDYRRELRNRNRDEAAGKERATW